MRKMKKALLCALLISLLLTSAENCFAAKYFLINNEYAINIDFGDKLSKQEREGYEPLTQRTLWERYTKSKEELPEEVPVIGKFEVKGKTKLFVSNSGDDSAEGTIDRPLKTIQKALDIVSRYKPSQKTDGVVIYIREGSYVFDKTLEITKEMCDTLENVGLIISSYNNEKVTIGCGASVKGSDFKKVDETNTDKETLNRVHPDAKGNLYYIDYETIGMDNMHGFKDGQNSRGSMGVIELNESELKLSRYPDTGWDHFEEIINGGRTRGDTVFESAVFRPIDKKVFTWKQTGTIGLYGAFCNPWTTSRCFYDEADPINQTISEWGSLNANNDPISKVLRYEGGGEGRFYYYNILEEANLPGDWCFDDEQKRIYIYPPDGKFNDEDTVSLGAGGVDTVVNANGAANVIINGISMSFCNNAAYLENCNNVVFQDCEFKNVTGNALNIKNSYKCGVIYSKFGKCNAGVLLGQYGNGLTGKRNFVQNCYFIGGINGIFANSGAIISHNFFTGLDSECVYPSGSETITEYNEILCSNLKGIEGGFYYALGSFNNQNQHMRRNYFHDSRAPLSNDARPGISMIDDMGQSLFAYENIYDDRKAGTVGSHGGDYSVFDGNIFWNCKSGGGNSTHYYMSEIQKTAYLNDARNSVLLSSINKSFNSYAEWRNRYPEVKKQVDFMIEQSDKYVADKETFTSDENKWIGTDTGCYYVNNIYVNTKFSGPTKLGLEYTHKDEDVLNHPEKIKQEYGMDWNVIENEQFVGSFDYTSLDWYDRTGVLDGNRFIDEIRNKDKSKISDLYVTYPQSPKEQKEGDSFDIAWLGVPDCDFYRVTISYDPGLKNPIICEDVNTTEFTTNKLLNVPYDYFYKIEAYGLSKTKNDKNVLLAQSPVHSIKFKSTYVIPSDGKIFYGNVTVDGVMDEVYKDGFKDVINSKYDIAGTAQFKKTYNTGEIHYAWDENYLYVYAQIKDDNITTAGTEYMKNEENPWQTDVLEMYINGKKFSIDAMNSRFFGNYSADELKNLPQPVVMLTKGGNIVSDTSDVDKENMACGYTYENADGFIIEMALPLKKEYGDVLNGSVITVRAQNNDLYDPATMSAAYKQESSKKLMLDGSPYTGIMSFEDVTYKDWFYNDVRNVYIKGLTDGVSETEFLPNGTISKAMFAAMLCRIDNKLSADEESEWYAPYTKWARENNIMDCSDSEARESISRREMALALYRYSKYKKKQFVNVRTSVDIQELDRYDEETQTAIKALALAGIIDGYKDGTFGGDNFLTRAEASAVINRYINSSDNTGSFMEDIAGGN